MNQERGWIIILAETRAYDITFPLFKASLLAPYKADLALCAAKNPRDNRNNSFYGHAKYVRPCDEPEDWGTAFDEIQASLNYHGNCHQLLEIEDQWLGGGMAPAHTQVLQVFSVSQVVFKTVPGDSGKPTGSERMLQ